MKKDFDYKQVSNKTCKDCGRPLKMNLLKQHPDASRCWVCWRISTGSIMSKGKNLHIKQMKNRKKYDWKSKSDTKK